jgi:SAM-dependent methyltransferase
MSRGLPDEFAPPDKSYCLYEGIEYQEYWDDRGRTRQDALERHIISQMLPDSGRRIIDLGCGYGRLAPCYLDRFDEVVLFDGSMSLLRDARAALGSRALLVAGDLASLPFKRASFDCVLTIRVLQHVHDLPSALKEMRRIVAGSGRLVFSYHNKRNAHRVLHLREALQTGNPFSLESVEVSPTLLSHNPTLVDALVRDAGFATPKYQGAAVVDSLATITERLWGSQPAGARWAGLMGRLRLAPWLIGSSSAEGNGDLNAGDTVDDLFQCPICRGDLDRFDQRFECPTCRRGYPVRDGAIFDFRP